MESDAFRATIIDGLFATAVRAETSVDVSRANVDFVVGDRPKFTDETTRGLQRKTVRRNGMRQNVEFPLIACRSSSRLDVSPTTHIPLHANEHATGGSGGRHSNF